MNRIPLIGISGFVENEEHTVENYTDAVRNAGGAPLVIPILTDDALLDSIVAALDGVVMSGGHDFDPLRTLGEEPVAALGGIVPHLDEFNIKLVRKAVAKGIPVLGVCRGEQLLAVAFGGSLWQDIPSQCPQVFIKHRQTGTPASYGTHSISIEKDSFLEKTLGGGKAIVNSLHHQAVKDIPQGFKAVAFSTDGVIEALERVAPLAPEYEDGGAMIIGTQFHPELLVRGDDKSSEAIFRLLVEKASSSTSASCGVD